LGAVRDADVLLERLRGRATRLPLEDQKAADAVIAIFDKECSAARDRLAKLLRQKRYLDLLDELVTAAAEPRFAAKASEPALDVLPSLVRRRWKQLCKAVDGLSDPPGDDQLHQVRIKAKKCRYAAEAAGPVGGKPVARFAKRVAKLQTILGDLHDAVVAEQRLREVRDGHALVFAAGAMASMEARVAEEARASWKKAWKKAAKKSLRTWL
jgi:CHAD domain-containing protein